MSFGPTGGTSCPSSALISLGSFLTEGNPEPSFKTNMLNIFVIAGLCYISMARYGLGAEEHKVMKN